MYSLLFVGIWCICLGHITIRAGELKYGVALTTIPPRFGIVYHQLQSWLDQTIPPLKIRIYIPKAYKRFRNKRTLKDAGSFVEQLARHLHNTQATSVAVTSNLIEIIEMNEDWGPLTKFIGTIVHSGADSNKTSPADYWIFCDDDVAYSPQLAAHYVSYVNAYSPSTHTQCDYHAMGFTMFTTEQRLQFNLQDNAGLRRVPHIQGVDSYIVPSDIFASSPPHFTATASASVTVTTDAAQTIACSPPQLSRSSPLSNATNVISIIRRIHSEWCPEAFYQDDYIASYLLYLAGVRMHSARLAHPACYTDYGGEYVDLSGVDCTNGVSMTMSIEGVSKHIFQMHMNEQVFTREYITQQCLMAHANEVYSMLFEN